MLATVLTVTVTTRYLGPSSYGALTTAVVFVGLWSSLTELGIGVVVVRLVMSGNGSLERLVQVYAGISLITCIPLFAIAAASGVAVYHDRNDVVKMTLIISFGLVITTISSCFQPVFMATVRFTAVAISDLLSRVTSLAVTMVLIRCQAMTEWFALVQLVPPVVVLLIQGRAAARIVNWRPVFSLQESWQLLRESLPQTAVLIIGVLYWRADGFILSLRSTPDQVGIYGLACALAFSISVLAAFFATSTLSAMTHLYAQNRGRFAHFVAKSTESMLFVGMPIAVVGAILATEIVSVVGSREFVDHGGPTLALLLVAVALTFLTGVLSLALFAAHDQIFLMRLNIVALSINVVLNIVLAPSYGAVGAGIALVTTEFIGLVVANWRLRTLAPYRVPWRFALRLVVPLAASAGVAVSTHGFPVLLIIPFAAIVYLAANLVAGPVTLKEIKALFYEPSEANGPTSAAKSNETEAR